MSTQVVTFNMRTAIIALLSNDKSHKIVLTHAINKITSYPGRVLVPNLMFGNALDQTEDLH